MNHFGAVIVLLFKMLGTFPRRFAILEKVADHHEIDEEEDEERKEK